MAKLMHEHVSASSRMMESYIPPPAAANYYQGELGNQYLDASSNWDASRVVAPAPPLPLFPSQEQMFPQSLPMNFPPSALPDANEEVPAYRQQISEKEAHHAEFVQKKAEQYGIAPPEDTFTGVVVFDGGVMTEVYDDEALDPGLWRKIRPQ